jgi:uroporphyrinogen-III synthase
METNPEASLQGLRVLSFESRRAEEMGELIRRYGGEPVIAPSMREVPLDENPAAIDFIRQLETGAVDFVIFLTGVGTRALAAAVASRYSTESVAAALRKATLVARGPKPVTALKELGLSPDITVPEPNTWRDVLSELDSRAKVKGCRVAVQEYGVTNQELIAGLEAREAKVVRVPVYRWALPEDIGPLRSAIGKILDGKIDIALFTNATQVYHIFQVADGEHRGRPLREAFHRIVIAAIGPICNEALEHFGLHADLEPDHPKMGRLVASVARYGRDLLTAKREKSK